jgi:hypothetical protein
MSTESEKRAKNKYGRERMTSIAFRLHNENDAELIEIYRSIPDKAGWFREVLREYKRRAK